MTATRRRSISPSGRATRERSGLDELRLRRPAAPKGVVERTRLIKRLQEAADLPVVSIVAPAGYGKTVLMSNWVESETRPVAWLSLDRSGDDPATLLSDIAEALRIAGLLRPEVGSAFHFTSGAAISHGIPRLIRALEPGADHGILALDNLGALSKRTSIDVIGALVHQLEGRLQVAITSRTDVRLPISTFRAQGKVLELLTTDLAFDEGEATQMLDALGIDADYDLDEMMERTEGWPVGVYLSGLASQVGYPGAGAVAVGGDDLYIAEYLRHEILDHLSTARVSFLTRTSILDQLNGGLCDAVLDTAGSGRVLEALEHANLFINRLDRTREWHRYHHMFQDLLKAELHLREPEIVPLLHGRAAEWYEANEMPEIAIHHAQAAGDGKRVARLVEEIGRFTYAMGRYDSLIDWLDWLERRGDIARNPGVAAVGALASTVGGDLIGVERWTTPGESPNPVARLADALQTRSGTRAMIEDARLALEELPPGSGFRAGATLMEGLGWLWEGEVEHADALFAEAVSLSGPLKAVPTATVALAERAIIAMEAGDWSSAEQWAKQALRHVVEHGLEGYPSSALGFVVAARMARRRNDIPQARALLAQAASLRPRLNATQPGLSVQTYIEMAKGYLELSDGAGARLVLREAKDIVLQRPNLGLLTERLDEVRGELSPAPGTVGPSALTTAELRLLPMLATHLTFPEIGERLYISRHTVKTQAMSIYRKLGASSRSEAVEAAHKLGLLGVSAEFTLPG